MKSRHAENGSAIFYILIAIMLLAALSYAVSRGSRSGESTLTKDQERLYAQEILDYANTVSAAVQKLKLRGCKNNEISFETAETGVTYINPNAPPDNTCHVFHPEGGAITYVDGVKALKDVGEDPLPKPYVLYSYHSVSVPGMGTDESDLVMFITSAEGLAYTFSKVCLRINKILGIQSEDETSLLPDELSLAPKFVGVYGAGSLSGESSEFFGKQTYCFYEHDSYFSDLFMHVLIAR